jgi:hypothetical protein
VQQGIIWLWHALLAVCLLARHLSDTKALCTAATLALAANRNQNSHFVCMKSSMKLGSPATA